MTTLDRRSFVRGVLGVACCAAASPLVTPVTLAAAPGDNRLVIIILRGAMDGLGVFAPYGDPNYRALRPTIARQPDAGLIDLDGRFGMDDRLDQLLPLWRKGELAVAHAVSTPYRGKRSHFDGQDLLESGGTRSQDAQDGWLNRAIGQLSGARPETAIAVGRESMLLTRGKEPVRSWAPGQKLTLQNDERALLQMIYARDPLFANAMAAASSLSELSGDGKASNATEAIARYAAERLNDEARLAAFSIGGWDTHASQQAALGAPLKQLELALVTLRSVLGANWGRTMVIAMTEFGRTARENGNRGTDHGTGGAAVLAGGAIRGGRIYGDWPGLADGDLEDGRDLRPTADVRLYPAWALAALYGLPRGTLEREVFPGLDMGTDPGVLG